MVRRMKKTKQLKKSKKINKILELNPSYKKTLERNKDKEYYEKAIEKNEKKIDSNSENLGTYLDLGIAYEELINIFILENKNEKAIEKFLKIAEKLKNRIKKYKKIIDSNSENFKAYVYLGILYGELGMLQKKIGIAYPNNEKYEKRIESYEKAIKNSKKAIDNYEKAIKSSKKKLNYNRNKIKCYITIGISYQELGEIFVTLGKNKIGIDYLKKGIKNLKKLKKLKNKALINLSLGVAYIKLGRIFIEENKYGNGINNLKKAIILFEKIINLNSKKIQAYINLGSIYGELGEIFRKEGENKKAIKFHLKSIENSKKGRDSICREATAYSNLAASYWKIGEILILEGNEKGIKIYLKGIQEYEKAINIDKNSRRYLFFLGEILIEYLKIKEGKEKTITYLKKIEKNKKNKNYAEEIEKFIKYKCYILINNLKKVDSLDNKIKDYLKLKILENLEKEFKLKIKSLKNVTKDYQEFYYMYKTIDKRLISDLNANRIWKGKPEYFNDPFDPYYKKFPTLINKKLNEVRISCFAEEYNNLLMWSHYGDNHKGICFGYKIENIHVDNLTFFEKVIYEELKTKIGLDDTNKLLGEIKEELLTISEVYLRKHKDWGYEKEWRLINLDYAEDYYYNMEISEVYFGIDCNEEDKKLIMKLLKDRNKIEYFRMKQGDNLSLSKQRIKLSANGQIEDILEKKQCL